MDVIATSLPRVREPGIPPFPPDWTPRRGLRYGRPLRGREFGSWPGFRTGMWGRAPFLGMEPLGNYGIHIIVKGGNVMLFGTVSSEADKIKAGMQARSVFGVRNVDNQIQVVRD